MNYQAQANQDKFVSNILNFKRDGSYLDIGSCHAQSCNNTYCFEALGWKGICIEMDCQHNDSYNSRKCKYINGDALTIDYTKLFQENNVPNFIDYLSLDVDAASTEVLKRLPLEQYKFGIITIEHDYYIHSGIYRDEQREILSNAGYKLYCADVLVPLQSDTSENLSFEDWWIFGSISHLPEMRERMYPKEIIKRLG